MAHLKLDDPDVVDAMRAYLAAYDALDHVSDEADMLAKSEAKSLAALVLRKRLTAVGIVQSTPVITG
jgi:hypothetical protein